jgi:propionyl-CoA carboxylase alpha chain
MPTFSTVLVANRGEIARRVFRTAKAMGLRTVAVHSDADADSPHVREADVAVRLPGNTSAETYLVIDKILEAARKTGADAIHPGYGFLSENAAFAEACATAGLTFIGPSPDSMRKMGIKHEAKAIAKAAGVPVLPDALLTSDDPEDWRKQGAEVGFPLLVKASAGGGGKGMRLVADADGLADAVAGARREALAAFGDGTVFLERYLTASRHVEVQVFGDTHGNALSLGERECSVQRRHQKVLEESPSAALDAELRARMSAAAVAFARAIGYVSAGTAEFMLDGRDFYFLELNARIQVEHPVTELVTGRDLVREQLRIADGATLVPDSYVAGHAVEVRLYAEDPLSFLPQAGRIERLRLPDTIRVDAGVEEGDEIGTSSDPMIAKLIAYGATRAAAYDALAAALCETEVGGVTTNLPFLRWLVAHPLVQAGRATTAFLTEHPPLSEHATRAPDPAWTGAWRLNMSPPPPRPVPSVDAGMRDHGPAVEQSSLTAPMPGTVIKVLVEAGAQVRARQTLLVLEAMKMESPLVSPYDATVRAVHVAEGDRVAGGALLVELEE